ncbi:hypothetical protein ON010_g1728 [Phytophthora cinnamomi]|nr:hypothetical protein ON010_g1728 [Phytophthora cinnamomi]
MPLCGNTYVKEAIVEKQTREWLDRHFSGVFDKLVFADEDSAEHLAARKKELYDDLKVKVAVGADAAALADAAQDVGHVVVVGSVPWTKQDSETRSGVVQVADWTAAPEVFEQLIKELELQPLEKVFAGPRLARYTDDLVTVSTRKPAVHGAEAGDRPTAGVRGSHHDGGAGGRDPAHPEQRHHHQNLDAVHAEPPQGPRRLSRAQAGAGAAACRAQSLAGGGLWQQQRRRLAVAVVTDESSSSKAEQSKAKQESVTSMSLCCEPTQCTHSLATSSSSPGLQVLPALLVAQLATLRLVRSHDVVCQARAHIQRRRDAQKPVLTMKSSMAAPVTKQTGTSFLRIGVSATVA